MKLGSFACLVIASFWHDSEGALTFPNSTAIASVPEDAAVGTSVYQATANGSSQAITYYLFENGTGDPHFHIDNVTGLVKTIQSLDHETKPSYGLIIMAQGDNANASVSLTVLVSNLAPKFSQESFTVNVADGSTGGTFVGEFKATDPGSGNTSIHYIIVNGNINNTFVNNDTTGGVYVSSGRTLNRTEISSYKLILHAVDLGNLTGSATITVTVGSDDESGSSVLSASLLAMMAWVLAYWLKG